MRVTIILICSLFLIQSKSQTLKGKNTYDDIPAAERHKFIVPAKQLDYYYASKPFYPLLSYLNHNDTNYYNAIPIENFNPGALIKGKGIAMFTNKHNKPIYVKDAQWYENDSDNDFNNLFSEGNAEILLVRQGKLYYHYGWSVSEGLAFGWNIYSRDDGKIEFGMVGGRLALYPLKVLDFTTNTESYQTKELVYKGKKCSYYGQVINNKAKGFGMVLRPTGELINFGFWNNDTLEPVASVLAKLYSDCGIKTEEWRGKHVSFGGLFDKKRRTITGFFEKSRKSKTPHGWFVSRYGDESKVSAFAGYYPENEKYPDYGPLESENESYGVLLVKTKTYTGYWVDKPVYYKVPFQKNVYKFSNSEALSYKSSGIPWNSAATIHGLTFNYTSNEILEAQALAKKLAAEERAKRVKAIYKAAIAKPGDLVRGSAGRYFYVDRINEYDECLELYPFPFSTTNYDLAQRSQNGDHKYPNEIYCRYSMSNYDGAMQKYCSSTGLTTVNKRICPRCSGSGEVLSTSTIATDGTLRDKTVYTRSGNTVYKTTYRVPQYGSKTVYNGVRCSKCLGKGYH